MVNRSIGEALKDQRKANDTSKKRRLVVLIFKNGFFRIKESGIVNSTQPIFPPKADP
jgi:hypothetical protein